MKTKEQIKLEINSLQERVNEAQEELFESFNQNLIELFQAHPEIKSLSMGVNNHEFNDGDSTNFSLYHEDMTIHTKDDEFDGYSEGKEKNPLASIRDSFIELFSFFDLGDFYERNFNDAYENISFSVKNGKLKSE